jgi:hypothetical protein
MSAPVATDLVIYGSTTVVPSNNTSALGGAIDTSTALSSASLGADLASVSRGATDVSYYAVIYFKNNCASPGSLQFARIYNRSGAVTNTAAGSLQYVSTSTLDNTTILTTGKVAGVFTQELVTLTGTTPVTGTKIWDVTSVIRHESLTAGTSPVKLSGNVTISSTGQILCVMYGTLSNPPALDLAVYTCTTEFSFALATTKNTAIASANRLTAPTTIGTFYPATFWVGADASLGVTSASLGTGEYIGVAVRYQSFTGAPETVSNELDHFPILIGTPSGS